MRVVEYWKTCGYCAEKTYVTPATLHYVKDNMYKGGKSYPYWICDTCRSWNQFDDELKSILGIEKVIDRTTMEIPQTGLRYKYKLVSTYPNSTLFSMVASMAAEQGIPWTGWKYKLFSLPTRAFIGSVTWIINKFTNKAIEPLDDMRTYICQRLIEPIGASSDLKTSSEVTQQVWH